MKLLDEFLSLTAAWRDVFPQQRTFDRARRQALGSLICLGRRCLSRIRWSLGDEQLNWSSDYFLFSRCRWNPQKLFQPLLKEGLSYCRGRLVGVALDDTGVRKTGRCIPQAFYQRDPMGPPFHLNLVLGLRFLQASLLLPPQRKAHLGARAVPIRFEEVSRVKKPGKRATEEMQQHYREASKQQNLSRRFVNMAGQLRNELDHAGGHRKILVLTGDGSFCNRTCFAEIPERSVLLVRARKNSQLCFRAPEGSRRFYGAAKFTPEQVRVDENRRWTATKVFYGGKRRKIYYKVVDSVLWQNGAKRRPLRLIVVRATPYRKTQSKKLYYRDPAYLLTTDLNSSVKQLLQIYFDRWQIEVNHRDEKDTLGLGQAQLWNVNSVPKQPVLVVAAYSALLLASLRAFGPERGDAFAPLPKWRRNARRPSCLDLVTLLRKELTELQNNGPLHLSIAPQALLRAAAA